MPHFSPPITTRLGSAPPRRTPQAASRPPPFGGEAGVRPRHHRLIGGVGLTLLGAQPAPSRLAASRRFFTVAVGGLRPSSFSPLRLTQITGHVHLQERRDVGLVATGDVDPALLAADPPCAFLEVGGVRLVASHLLRRNHQVEVSSQVTARDAEQLVVDVRDDPDLVALGQPVGGRVSLPERQPASDAVGKELGARGLDLPADLVGGPDRGPPEHLGVELVGAADDLGLDLEEPLR